MKHFTTSDGLRLAYRDEGAGLPVLCLTGLTRDSTDFDDFAATLDEGIRLIRLDYRGRGASDRDPDYRNYAVRVEARDALELLDHLGIGRTVVVGTSRGGLIAMVLAATAPERLAGVMLNDIGPVVEEAGITVIKGYLGRDPGYATHADIARDLPTLRGEDFANVPEGRWRSCARRWWRETPDGLTITYDPKLRDAMLEGLEQPPVDLWPVFDCLREIPLALVRGVNSNILSHATAQEMQRRIPGMIWNEVPDRGHVPFLDEAECVAAFAALRVRVEG